MFGNDEHTLNSALDILGKYNTNDSWVSAVKENEAYSSLGEDEIEEEMGFDMGSSWLAAVQQNS